MNKIPIMCLLLLAAISAAATVTIDSVSYDPSTITEDSSTTLTIVTKETSATGNASVDLLVTLSAGLQFSDTNLATASKSFTIDSGSSNVQTFSIDAVGSGPQTITTTLSSASATVSNGNDQQTPCVKPSACTLTLDASSSDQTPTAGDPFSISASVTSCVCNYEAQGVNVTIFSTVPETDPTKSLGTVTSTSAASPWHYNILSIGVYEFTLTATASNANQATKTVSVNVTSSAGACTIGSQITTACICDGVLRTSGWCCSGGYSTTECSSGETPPADSGGGAGGAPAPGPEIVKESKLIPQILPNEPANASFTKPELAVTEIELILNTDATLVVLAVEKNNEKPASVTEAISASKGMVYRYLTITATSIQASDINTAKIKFTVERDWLVQNNIDPSTVALMRYTSGSWQALKTVKTSETSTTYYYESETPGFSVFAITGELKAAAQEPEVAEEPEETLGEEEEQEKEVTPELPKLTTPEQPTPQAAQVNKGLIALILVLFSAVIAAGVYYIKTQKTDAETPKKDTKTQKKSTKRQKK